MIKEAFSTFDGVLTESNIVRYEASSIDIERCEQRAYDLFRSRIGQPIDLALYRLAEECASEAIQSEKKGIATRRALTRGLEKQKTLDRIRYGLRSSGRPVGSKTRKTQSDLASKRSEHSEKIMRAIQKIYDPQKWKITRKEVARMIGISDPTLRAWLKDLSIDNWDDFVASIARSTEKEN